MRKAPWLLWVLLCLVVGLHVRLMLLWIKWDHSVGQGICCSMTVTLEQLIQSEATGRLRHAIMDPKLGLMSWLALAGRHLFGPDTDFLLKTSLALIVLTQLVLFDIGRLMGGPLTGLLAAGLFPLYPEVALATRRWSVHAPQYLFLALAADCLIRSKSFSRWLPSLGFVITATLGALMSSMPTDNLLFVAAAGSMAFGAVARGLLLGRGPLPAESLPRLRVLMGGALVTVAVACALARLLVPYIRVDYYSTELSAKTYQQALEWWRFQSLTAYGQFLFRSSISPVLTYAFLLALLPFLLRGPARAELLTWFVVPLLALSLIAKKNPYYMAVVYPVIPLATLLGIQAIPWRVIRCPAFSLLMGLAALQWYNRSFPSRHRIAATFLATPDEAEDLQPLFQTPLIARLNPQRYFGHERLAAFLEPVLPRNTCPRMTRLAIFAPGDYSSLVLKLSAINPCLEARAWNEVLHHDQPDYLVSADVDTPPWEIRPPVETPPGTVVTCSASGAWREELEGQIRSGRYELIVSDRSQAPCLHLFQRKGGPPGLRPAAPIPTGQREG